MRHLYAIGIGLLLALVLVFAFQNAALVRVSFLTIEARLPLWLLALGLYVLGMLTGGFMVALVRRWLRRARA